MSMRFFATADAALYESIRLQLDAAWNLAAHGCTCITPAADAPRSASGRIVLAVNSEFAEYEIVAAMLPQLLASGAVTEIDVATYHDAVKFVPTPTPTPQDPAPFNFSPNPTLSVFTPKNK